MIRSYGDKRTEAVAQGMTPKGFPADLIKAARYKLYMLDNATHLDDLRSPPGNRLHALEKDRKGQHAIRINNQFRLCFSWSNGGADGVEIVDYH